MLNTRHAFRVESDTARILNGYTPRRAWRRLIAELGNRTTERTLPPPGPVAKAGSMPDELLTRYGLMWLSEPDPLEPRVSSASLRFFAEETFDCIALVPRHAQLLPALQYDNVAALEPRLYLADAPHINDGRTMNANEFTWIKLLHKGLKGFS